MSGRLLRVSVIAACVLGAAVVAAGSSRATPAAGCGFDSVTGQTSCSFASTGAEQTFLIPEGVTRVHVVARGAAGAASAIAAGGRGAVVSGELNVDSGATLYIEVGGAPTTSSLCRSAFVLGDQPCVGGFNGGGSSVADSSPPFFGGGGGGASDVRTVASASAGSLASRVVVAAGGGGGAGNPYIGTSAGAGGDAGSAGTTAPDQVYGAGSEFEVTAHGGTGGGAGSTTAGGAAGIPDASAGSLGQGGATGATGGGGGGGLYGGGGGGSGEHIFTGTAHVFAGGGGGGGGSSLIPAGGSSGVTTDPPGITITYKAAGDELSYLQQLVASVGPGSSLSRRLAGTRRLIGVDPAAACRSLAAFAKEVDAQVGKHITSSDGAAIRQQVLLIRQTLGC